jgi:hypothetical protein
MPDMRAPGIAAPVMVLSMPTEKSQAKSAVSGGI